MIARYRDYQRLMSNRVSTTLEDQWMKESSSRDYTLVSTERVRQLPKTNEESIRRDYDFVSEVTIARYSSRHYTLLFAVMARYSFRMDYTDYER